MRVRLLAALVLTLAATGCAQDGFPRANGFTPLLAGQVVKVDVGQTVDFDLYTHCGVEGAEFNGLRWRALVPLYSSPQKHSPPDGWGNPYQQGRLTLEVSDRAVFNAEEERVVLVPVARDAPAQPCD